MSAPSENDLAQAASQPDLPDLATSVALVRRARGGEEDALGELFERYRGRLARIVRVELGNELARHVEPEDILTEVFLVARRRIADFEPRSRASILAWLVTIAKNKVKDERMKRRAAIRDPSRERPLEGSSESGGGAGQLRADASGPASRAFKREVRDILDETVAELPEDYRRVILLRDYYDAEWDEIATELARGRHACEELHRRAWIRLKLDAMRKIRPG